MNNYDLTVSAFHFLAGISGGGTGMPDSINHLPEISPTGISITGISIIVLS